MDNEITFKERGLEPWEHPENTHFDVYEGPYRVGDIIHDTTSHLWSRKKWVVGWRVRILTDMTDDKFMTFEEAAQAVKDAAEAKRTHPEQFLAETVTDWHLEKVEQARSRLAGDDGMHFGLQFVLDLMQVIKDRQAKVTANVV